MARKRDPNRPRKVAPRRSNAPLVTPQRWFFIIITALAAVIGTFFLLGILRRLL